ncbi:MAG: carboxypeptidase-like regulatory domain-containing protein [bacterium]|nr:carboxypeptidase-like regulatory domain-containing protein [bacterium]
MKVTFFIIALVVAITNSVFAQEYGKIEGTIIDDKTKEPIIGAVINIFGTALGANTGLKGYFMITNVPESTYTVQAKQMGYKSRIKEKVKVLKNETTILNIKLKKDVFVETHHYQPSKVKTDQTQTIHIIPAEKIEHTPKK